jgi:tripartite-type tricarboxylate transporter receptor subunit TctC
VLLSKQAGVKMVHVPYRGGGPAMNDALAGHVDLLVGSTALSIGQINAGKLRALLQTGKSRTAALPDIPTAIDAGFPGFEAYAWWGVFAPAGTPKPMIERFGSDLAATVREPAILKQLAESQQVTLDLGGPDSMRRFLAAQMKQWGAVVKENNITGDAG